MKNKYLKYFFLSICLTFIITLIKRINLFGLINNSKTLRKLLDEDIINYTCNKADSELIDKYKGDFNETVVDIEDKLNDDQRSMVQFIKHSNYDNIKPYLKRIWFFILFLVLVIIFIFLWISYCPLIYYEKIFFKKVQISNKYRLIIFIIINVLIILTIIFSIITLSTINPFFRKINGIICSTLKIFEHIAHGLYPSYPNESSHWTGLAGIAQKFEESQYEYDNIDYTDINDKFNIIKNNYENIITTTECLKEFKDYGKDKDSFYNFVDNTFEQLNFGEEIKYLKKAYDIVEETEKKIIKYIDDTMHNLINKHLKNINLSIFVIIIIFSVVASIILFLYYFYNNKLFKSIYIVIWNISMLLMIFSFFISIITGIIGYLLKDGVQIYNYIFSEDNLYNIQPIIIITKNEYLGELIDYCANYKQNGEFLEFIQSGLMVLSNVEKLSYEVSLEKLEQKNCEIEARDALIEFYQSLLNQIDVVFGISYNFLDIKCNFLRNDKFIVLRETKEGGEKSLELFTYQFLVGIFLIFSTIGGILFVHKFIPEGENNENKIIKIDNATNVASKNTKIKIINEVNLESENKISDNNENK